MAGGSEDEASHYMVTTLASSPVVRVLRVETPHILALNMTAHLVAEYRLQS